MKREIAVRTAKPTLQAPVQQRIIHLLQDMAPTEGYHLTPMESVRVLRADGPLARTPVLYDPGIVIVCQGRKRGYFGGELYLYDEQHYLAVSVPVPFTMETDATPRRPLLALYLHLDFTLAAELALQIDRQGAPAVQGARSMMSSPMEPALQGSLLRFLEAMAQPQEAAILGTALLREIYYRVLTGAQGEALRNALAMRGHFGKIGRVLRRIHTDYAQDLDVMQLAAEAGMSAPSFYVHFKEITQASPMQYLKSIRLHQARLLMVREEMAAEAAAHAVGYVSTSQFSREFKRLFGATPVAECRRLRESFALPPGFADAQFVSSH